MRVKIEQIGEITYADTIHNLIMGQALAHFILQPENERHVENIVPSANMANGDITIDLISRFIQNAGNNSLNRKNSVIAGHTDPESASNNFTGFGA
ncbi:MAG: hypothetical protein NXI27_18155 [Alphaproteobacteria bacterium]|nr:hypothetical protein [Alphaproteobacteria bacterium]